jgi:hypothetical protein
LREEYRLRVFENRVLREIFKPTRHEVIGERRGTYRVLMGDISCKETTWKTLV